MLVDSSYVSEHMKILRASTSKEGENKFGKEEK